MIFKKGTVIPCITLQGISDPLFLPCIRSARKPSLKAFLLYTDDFSCFSLPSHPLKPFRLKLTDELIRIGLFR